MNSKGKECRLYHTSVKSVMVNRLKTVKNKHIQFHNRWRVSQNELSVGGLQACITKCDKSVGDLKTGKQPYFMDGPLRHGIDNSWNGKKTIM